MKLNIELKRTKNHEYWHITDDRGEKLPCLRVVTVQTRFNDATIITLELIVDQVNIVMGTADEAE